MKGSEAMVHTLLAGGVDVCFTNPGTSEMHFVSALDRVPKMRCVLGLFEGVVTGAADGYYRMADKPAATLLHLGPGFGNGIANLHNAKRARSGIVNIVGQHATDHIANDAPLTADIEGLARPVSHWVKTTESAHTAPADTAAAITQAAGIVGKIATLILPADAAWSESETGPASVERAAPAQMASADTIEAIARLLKNVRDPGSVALLLGGRGTRARAAELAGKIAARTGCKVFAENKNARSERGTGRVNIPQLPYPVDAGLAMLKDIRLLILVGASNPVAFFAYPGKPRVFMPQGSETHTLATPFDDIDATLAALCESLDAQRVQPALLSTGSTPGPLPTGKAAPEHIGHVVAALLPENAVVVDEAITSGRHLHKYTLAAAPHDWLELTGGAIGFGLPTAVGAAIACPDRKVLAIVGDGSAMYTVQALWTMAREGLDITVVICANRAYKVLYGELESMGGPPPGPSARRMLMLDEPALDWVALAKGHGVEAHSVATLEAFAEAMRIAMKVKGPRLIELLM
jgi:acetolactate synthase-1/2/3 large subunit